MNTIPAPLRESHKKETASGSSNHRELRPEDRNLEDEISTSYLNDLEFDIDLEEEILNEFSKNKSPLLLDALSELRTSSENALKKVSAETTRIFNSNYLVTKLRDVYIDKHSIKLNKQLQSSSGALRAEDCSKFLKLLKSDFWGNDKKNDDICYSVQKFLEIINTREPELSEEVSAVWPRLLSKNNNFDTQKWGYHLDSIINKKINESGNEDKKLDIANIDDDFVALRYFTQNTHLFDKKELDKQIFKHFDSIIYNNSDLKSLPENIFNLLLKLGEENPSEIIKNSQRQSFLFSLWINSLKNDHYQRSETVKFIPLFADYINDCSEKDQAELTNTIFKGWQSSYSNDNFRWLLAFLPLSQKELQKREKQEPELVGWPPFLFKKELLDNDKQKGLKEDGLEFKSLLEQANTIRRRESVTFLSYLISRYPDTSRGVTEEELVQVLDSFLLPDDNLFDLAQIRCLNTIMSNHSWSDNLKTKVFKNNNISGTILSNIINNPDDEKFTWIKAEPSLLNQLELDFHIRAQGNDLRHYFYDVLDNKHQTDNFDNLIKSYALKENYFDAQTIINLFIDRKINKDYLPLFIAKTESLNLLNSLSSSLSNKIVTTEEYFLILEAAIKDGPSNGITLILRSLQNEGQLDNPEKRKQILNHLSQNILTKLAGKDEFSHTLREVFDDELLNSLNPLESTALCRDIMSGLTSLSNESNITGATMDNLSRITTAYPDDQERAEYLKVIINKLVSDKQNNNNYDLLISTYFANKNFFQILDADYRQEIENIMFELNTRDNSATLMMHLDIMNPQQQALLLKQFDQDYKVNDLVMRNGDLNNLCYLIASPTNFYNNHQAFTFIYKKLLNDPALDHNMANILFNKKIILENTEIKNIFLSNLERWPGINGGFMLRDLESPDHKGQSVLSIDDVKKISAITMTNQGLSPLFWNGYLNSDKEKPSFYLDESLFKIGLANIGEYIFRLEPKEIVDFLSSLETGKFELATEDKITIMTKALAYKKNTELIENFYHYDAALLEKASTGQVNVLLRGLLKTNITFSDDFNNKILDSAFANIVDMSLMESLCHHFKTNYDENIITEIKKRFDTFSEPTPRLGKMILLKNDLLDVSECKELYKEGTKKTENVRQQIINSIDIIGSMLSNKNNLNQLHDFLDDPRPENINDLENISTFINKYSKEDKGRSIATMLFAREYLPDRQLSKVIEKVASYLKKYEDVLEQYSYKNIPDGVHASIGMEYEITSSTADGYRELTNQDLKSDIAKISEAARIGSGRDAVHEIATKPTDNPYLMLLEMKLLHDIEYVDLNFDRSASYQKGARGFHLTIGGERGLSVNQDTQFLQNIIIAASWGGVQAGETGHRVNGGRGVSLRGRDANAGNNVPFFGTKTSSVELRSLSIDKEETLQRAVTTAFHGAVAIQALNKCSKHNSLDISNLMEQEGYTTETLTEELSVEDEKIKTIANIWLELIQETNKIIKRHNESFLEEETTGYLDEKDAWVDVSDFGGEYNKKRFDSIVANIDPTLSIEEYVKTTEIQKADLFKEYNITLSDKLVKINNLYLKPGSVSLTDGNTKKAIFKGDHANAISMLENTKLNNSELEYHDSEFLKKTVFETVGEKRTGYYYLQGGSEKMITHGLQRALIRFNQQMEEILN